MANIVISSIQEKAVPTAFLFAARNHSVAVLGGGVEPGKHSFSLFGAPCDVALLPVHDLDVTAPTVGIVYAAGEDITAGITRLLAAVRPDVLAVVGVGISGALESASAAETHGFDLNRLLLVGGFLAGGTMSSVTNEKHGMLAGFLGREAPEEARKIAETTITQISITDAPTVVLSGLNPLVHVPPMILNAMRVERGDDVQFYDEGFGESVCRLIAAIDVERQQLGAAMGSDLLSFEQLLDRYNGPAGMNGASVLEKINTFPPYRRTKLPSTFQHRFLEHELRSAFAPMAEMAGLLGVPAPTINAVVRLGEVLVDRDVTSTALQTAKEFLSVIGAPVNVARPPSRPETAPSRP
ncbi:NAD/NADP octopine/nopaline dehydrogenase family protein [Pseudarthrobacter sp. YAF2]|uniref:NAD/NADP octopine/nopaline dehydrogenase family protein n=1 Tax=Pseudarthrobacter sp. YAF2 TaxID=3233078 RepID=UPI003F9E5012